MEKCPVCKKFWEENWNGEQYCPECGQTKAQAVSILKRNNVVQKAQAKVETEAQKVARIQAMVEAHPDYGYAKRLTSTLAELLDLDVRVIFRNMRGSDCQEKARGKYLIRFGYYCIDDIKEYGFVESTKGAAWLCPEPVFGKEAIWALVLHELGHAALFNKGNDDGHGRMWQAQVSKLQALFPFADAENI